MTEIAQRSIGNGVNFRSIKDTRFKTLRISIHFMLPLTKDTAAANALLPFLMSRASRDFPDYTKLSERLSELYGAELNADVQKLGDVQVLTITAVGLADRYALNKECISSELAKLLCSVVFDPPFENGLFQEDGFLQEQRQTIELIESEYNDKRLYAKHRCEQIMCMNEPFGISRYGGKEDILSLRREMLTPTWKALLETAKIEIMVLGDCEPESVYQNFKSAFGSIPRNFKETCKITVLQPSGKVTKETEKASVAQSKLVLGYRTGAISSNEMIALKLMTAMYGSTPHSKLFLNVREKLSLCYYCSSRYNWNKGILLVESGVENENIEKATIEINNQLDELKNGKFDEDEICAAKKSMVNSYLTVEDYLGGMESWYLSQVFQSVVQTPQQAVQTINAINREQVIVAANKVQLDTVYLLVGSGEEAE